MFTQEEGVQPGSKTSDTVKEEVFSPVDTGLRRFMVKSIFYGLLGLVFGKAIDFSIEVELDRNLQLENLSDDAELAIIIEKLRQRPELQLIAEVFANTDSLAKIWGCEQVYAVGGRNTGYKKVIELVTSYVKNDRLDELVDLFERQSNLPTTTEIADIVERCEFVIDHREPHNEIAELVRQYTAVLSAFPLYAPVLSRVMRRLQIATTLDSRNSGMPLADAFGVDFGASKNYFANPGNSWDHWLLNHVQGRLPGLYPPKSDGKDSLLTHQYGLSGHLLDRVYFTDVLLHEFTHGFTSASFVQGNHGGFSRELIEQVGLKNYFLLIKTKQDAIISASKRLFDQGDDFLERFFSDPDNSRYFDAWMLSDFFGLSSDEPIPWEIGESIEDYLRQTMRRFGLDRDHLLPDGREKDLMLKFLQLMHKLDSQVHQLTEEEYAWMNKSRAEFYELASQNPATEVHLCLQHNLNCRGEAISGLHVLIFSLYRRSLFEKNNLSADNYDLHIIEQFNKRQSGHLFSLGGRMLSHIFHHLDSVVDPSFIYDYDSAASGFRDTQIINHLALSKLGHLRASLCGYKNPLEMHGALRRAIVGFDWLGEYFIEDMDDDLVDFLQKLGITPQLIKGRIQEILSWENSAATSSILMEIKKSNAFSDVLGSLFCAYYADGETFTCLNLSFLGFREFNDPDERKLFLVRGSNSKKYKIVMAEMSNLATAETAFVVDDLSDLSSKRPPAVNHHGFLRCYINGALSEPHFRSINSSTGEPTGFYHLGKSAQIAELPCRRTDGSPTSLTFVFDGTRQPEADFQRVLLPAPDYRDFYHDVALYEGLPTRIGQYFLRFAGLKIYLSGQYADNDEVAFSPGSPPARVKIVFEQSENQSPSRDQVFYIYHQNRPLKIVGIEE